MISASRLDAGSGTCWVSKGEKWQGTVKRIHTSLGSYAIIFQFTVKYLMVKTCHVSQRFLMNQAVEFH